MPIQKQIYNLLFNQANHSIEETTANSHIVHETDLSVLNQQIEIESNEKIIIVLNKIKEIMEYYRDNQNKFITIEEAKRILREELMREFKLNDEKTNE